MDSSASSVGTQLPTPPGSRGILHHLWVGDSRSWRLGGAQPRAVHNSQKSSEGSAPAKGDASAGPANLAAPLQMPKVTAHAPNDDAPLTFVDLSLRHEVIDDGRGAKGFAIGLM